MRADAAFFEGFASPPGECRPMPFWFWNSKLERGEVVRQVREFARMGLGGFYIHARFGLETEYLSDEWMEMIEAAAEEAGRLGLRVWLYDENLFPSGIGNARVSARTELRPRFIECGQFAPGADGVLPLALLPRGCAVFSVLRASDGARPEPIAYELAGDAIRFPEPPGGPVWVLWIGTPAGEGGPVFGVDYLNPDTLEAFIESTHEVYRRRLGRWFGGTIAGFFTDEPTLLPWHHDISWYKNRKDGLCAPYTPGLLPAMRRIAGVDAALAELAAALFFDVPGAEALRRAYWRTVSTLYEENYFRAYARWCEKNGLQLTGHVLLEEGLYFNHIFQAGPLAGLKHMHMPGTDQLGSGAQFDSMDYMVEPLEHIPAVRTNATGPKLVSSIAHAAGRRRVVSESFGVGGWRLGFPRMKATLDWLYALGVNRLCPHAFFYSIEGFRKLDAPPSFFHGPSARFFRGFADYAARLSWALSRGAPVADVALVYPESAFRAAYAVGRQRDRDRRISDAYDFLCLALLRSQRAFEIISEDALASARAEGGALVLPPAEESAIGGVSARADFLRFSSVLIPDATGMGAAARAALEALREGGGRAMALGDAPGGTWTLGEVSRRVAAFYGGAPGDVRVTGAGREKVYAISRRLDCGTLRFFANTSAESAFAGYISLGAPSASLLDPETGAVARVSAGCLRVDMPPSGSLLLYVPDAAAGARGDIPTPGEARIECPADPNARPIRADIPPSGEAWAESPVDPDAWSFRAEGDNALPLNDWALRIEASGMQTRYRYTAMVASEAELDGAALVLDDISGRGSVMGRPDVSVAVNGAACERAGHTIEPGFARYAVGRIRAGENEIRITITADAWSGDTRPLTVSPVLTGAFELRRADELAIAKPSAWTGFADPSQKGYPYYSGAACYAAAIDLPDSGRMRLAFEKITGCAELFVDGESLGARLWPPWAWEIPAAKAGRRARFELRVTNTLANYLGEACRFGPEGGVTLAHSPQS